MNLYEHTIIAKQNYSKNWLNSLKTKYSKIIEKNEGEIVRIDDWGLLNFSHIINKNRKGNYISYLQYIFTVLKRVVLYYLNF